MKLGRALRLGGLLCLPVVGWLCIAACGDDTTSGAGECVEPSCAPDPECTEDNHCPLGQVCVASVCQEPGGGDGTSCEANSDCAGGELCHDGACVTACIEDTDCDGDACVDSRCVARCMADADCPGAPIRAICEGNRCVTPECSSAGDCGPQGRCDGGRCAVDIGCQDDLNCPVDQRCDNGACVARTGCAIDASCAPNQECRNGNCFDVAACANDAACAAGERCIAGACRAAVCRGPGDCDAEQVCVLGACLAPSAPDGVVEVVILTPGRSIGQGERIALQAVALDVNGVAIPGVPLSWSTSASAVVDVEEGVAVGGASAGNAALTATATGTTPPVQSEAVVFTRLQPSAAGEVNVMVVDRDSREAIAGATVVNGAAQATTGADGVASVALSAGDGISIFHADYDYVTLVPPPGFAGELFVPLVPAGSAALEEGPVGGVTGSISFEQVKSEGPVEMAITGMSLGGDIADVELQHLVGDILPVELNSPLLQGQQLYLPSGVTLAADLPGLGLPNLTLRDRFEVLGRPGRRALWSLGGRLTQDVVNELLALIFMRGGNLEAPELIATLLPYTEVFEHDLRPALDVRPLARVADSTDRDDDGDRGELIPNYGAFPVEEMRPIHEQSLVLEVEVPPVPSLDGSPLGGVMLMTGAVVDGLGFVPLGVSGANVEASGAVGTVTMRTTPLYNGLEAGRYAVLVVGFPFSSGQGVLNLPTEIAVLWKSYATLPTEVSFQSFLPMPATGAVGLGNGDLRIPSAGGADLTRVVLRGADRRWVVWAPGSTTQLALPASPAGVPQLAFVQDRTSLSHIDLEAGVDAGVLMRATGPGLDDLNTVMTGFSRVDVSLR